MKTHSSAFEGAFFASMTLWLTPLNREKQNEYRSISTKYKEFYQFLGLSFQRLEAICRNSRPENLFLDGIDELKLTSKEVERLFDEIHSNCFLLGMHCGNLFGFLTVVNHSPSHVNTFPKYIENINDTYRKLPLQIPEIEKIINSEFLKISAVQLLPLIPIVSELLNELKITEQFKIKILFLAANPLHTSRLRIDEEIREIETGLEKSKDRENIIFISKHAVTTEGLQDAILKEKPTIVHFSGHGNNSGIVLDDMTVSSTALANLFEIFSDSVSCVVLNSCFSLTQAETIVKHIPFVVGTKSGLLDKAAIAFSIGFYKGIGAGEGYEFAFKLGRNLIELKGIDGEMNTKLLKKS